MTQIQRDLRLMEDKEYKAFHEKLMPTVPKEKVIGIRTPILRQYAKRVFMEKGWEEFLKTLPHKYYEEDNLHAFLIEKIKDYDKAIEETDRFLPFIDNWATTDSFLPKVFYKNKDRLIVKIKEWIKSDATYTKRYGIGLLLKLYLDEDFNRDYMSLVSDIKSEEYYVNMMIAWYFATALAKQYEDAVWYLENNKLSVWVHNKTIQKAIESNRITKDKKEYLRTLKIKKGERI